MKLLPAPARAPTNAPGITGPARLDRRTRDRRQASQPGDIAIIDHVDIDRAAAWRWSRPESPRSSTSRRRSPAATPTSARACSSTPGSCCRRRRRDAFSAVNDGDTIRVDGDSVYLGDDADRRPASARRASRSPPRWSSRKDGIASQLEAFSANAIEHLRRERGLLLDGEGVPERSDAVRRAPGARRAARVRLRSATCASLKTYIRENTPVLIGVDAGADALLEAGHRPDLVVICDWRRDLRGGPALRRRGRRRTPASDGRVRRARPARAARRQHIRSSRPAARPRTPRSCSRTRTAPR